jgi:uncharacterized protein YdeI (YjbR/CyaY-like superfamily)
VTPGDFHPADRAEWRQWLTENHASAPGVWLIYNKQASGKRRLTYEEAVEEALCYGWIDSRPNSIDEHTYKQLFSPRKPRSPWSAINKERVERLLRADLMAPPGLEKVEKAKMDGSWSVYDSIETLEIPEDLQAALAANEAAAGHFAAFSPSSKKGILWWIKSAKRAETRRKRIAETVLYAEANLRVVFDRPPSKRDPGSS